MNTHCRIGRVTFKKRLPDGIPYVGEVSPDGYVWIKDMPVGTVHHGAFDFVHQIVRPRVYRTLTIRGRAADGREYSLPNNARYLGRPIYWGAA